jgi:hypothetical protein
LTKKSVADRQDAGKSQVEKSEILRRIILGQLNRVYRDLYGPEFPDDDAGREDLETLLRYYALHPTHGRERMKNCIETRAPWMAKETAEYLIGDLAILDPRYLRLSPAELRVRVHIHSEDRERLMVWNIPPYDLTDAQLEQRRKDKKRVRDRARYKKTRPNYLMDSISRKKPWEAEGVSRATWYRKRTKGETGPRRVLAVLPSNSVNLSVPRTKPPKRLGLTKPRPCETSPRLAGQTLSDADLSQSQSRVSPRRKEAS